MKRTPPSPESTLARRRRRRRAAQYALLFVGCVILIDAFVGDKGLLEMVKKRAEYGGVAETLSRARTENAALREEIRRLREDPASIEDLARREHGLMKPGEKMFIIKDLDPSATRRN